MKDWFTVEKIDENTFALSEYGHWEKPHSYLLIGSEKALLIDSGLGIDNIYEQALKLTEKSLELITTHAHWDHIGGHKYFSRILVHENEKPWLEEKFPLPLKIVKESLTSRPCELPQGFNIDDYEIFKGPVAGTVKDGDLINLGNRIIKVIHTPGHSPGHICLFEEEKGYLFSGDLIYKGTLYAFYPSTNPYEFMLSVKKIRELSIKRILPGHNDLKIDLALAKEIEEGMSKIYKEGNLVQGNGIFQFNSFSLHI